MPHSLDVDSWRRVPGPASLHHGVHPPLPWQARAGDGLATTPPSFWGEGEAGEGWAMSGRPGLSCLETQGGPCLRSPTPAWLDTRVPTLALLPGHHLPLPASSSGSSHRHLDPVSLLPPAQGPGDSVTQTMLTEKKLSHLETPPAESIKAAASPGERPGGHPGEP